MLASSPMEDMDMPGLAAILQSPEDCNLLSCDIIL